MSHDHAGPRVHTSHHTLSGCRHGQRPRHSLVQRAAAAHQAGIDEIGACADDLGRWFASELQRLIRQDHVHVRELEWVELSAQPDEDEDILMRMADIFGARQLNVGVCDPGMISDGWLARRLGALARKAADHGLTVAFEPVVFGSVSSIDRVQHIIAAADEPNVGTLLDVYHMARTCWDRLDEVAPDKVVAVQISGIDRPLTLPSWPHGLWEESQCSRLMPDEGDFPVADWLTRLVEMGVAYRARLSVEVLSDACRDLPLYAAAARVGGCAEKFTDIWESR